MMKAFTVLYREKANNPPGAALCDSVKEKPPVTEPQSARGAKESKATQCII